jgi:hypothetical protein
MTRRILGSLLLLCACGDDGQPAMTTVFMPSTGSDAETTDDPDSTSPATTNDDTDDEATSDDPDTSASASTGDESSTGAPIGGPAGSCGMGGGTGEILQIELGSPERWYLIGARDTDEPLPLVLAFHGDEGDPFNSTRYIWGSYWEQTNEPFHVVMTKCPGCTSWYQGDTNANADYVWEVLADVAANHNVDVSRIYAIGFSGGSEFLGLHGFEFQDVFAGIQWTCGGGAYGPYTPPSRPDCKVHGRIVIAADDFLWDGAQDLLARLQQEGHPHEFVEAQCSGHCCDTDDDNSGAWAWFQQQVKCDAEVPGMCAELEALPPAPMRSERKLVDQPIDFDGAKDELDLVLDELEDPAHAGDRQLVLRRAMAAYDRMLAAAHRHGPDAKAELTARYPRLRAAMKQLATPTAGL